MLSPPSKVTRLSGQVGTAVVGRSIPAGSVFNGRMLCHLIDAHNAIQPVLFKGHTHAMGNLVDAWKRDGKTGAITLIAKQNPQEVRSYRVVEQSADRSLRSGDSVVAHCLMENPTNAEVTIG